MEFRGAGLHFGPSFAKAAQAAVVEAGEVVEPGEIPAERIGLPGIFLARAVRETVAGALPEHGLAGRGHDVPRACSGKPARTRRPTAELAASLPPEGAHVNLGLAMPGYPSWCAGGRHLIPHGENAILGGAIDLVASGRAVLVMTEHRDSRDRSKVVQRCSHAPTGRACVDIPVTDLAQFRRKNGRLAADQVAPGFTKEEVLARSGLDAATGMTARQETPRGTWSLPAGAA